MVLDNINMFFLLCQDVFCIFLFFISNLIVMYKSPSKVNNIKNWRGIMRNTKIGMSEAIAFLTIIVANFVVLDGAKSTIIMTSSSAIINATYVSILSLLISYMLYKLLSKFPTFDILDISNFLGGKVLRFIIGSIYFVYFVALCTGLLKNFAYSLQTIYYPFTNVFMIVLVFLIATLFISNLKYNAFFRSNLIILPLIITSILFLFYGNIKNYSANNIFPIMGNGIDSTFIKGMSNIFTFQNLTYLLFLPPYLKDITKFKKITILSMILSSFYFLTSVTSLILLFYGYVSNESLIPLYSAVRYIEFGVFFQRLDSLFLMIWIISLISYLCITINICSNILKKSISPDKSKAFYSVITSIIILILTLLIRNHAISTFLIENICNYAFFVILGISFVILLLALCIKIFKKNFKTVRIN